jgi:hypothetical protein
LNVSLGAVRTSESRGWVVLGAASYRAASDDERLGLVDAAVTAPDGVVVPAPRLESLPLEEIGPEEVPRDLVAPAHASLLSALRCRVAVEVDDFRRSVARRAARDAERLELYFRDVADDLRRRARKRGGEVLEAKRAALPLELETRMSQLEAGCRIRVEMKLVALAAVVGPAVTAEVEVRRRKHRRLVRVRLDGVTRRWSGVRCDGCGAATSAFAMCDEAEHVLCAACWDACGTGGHRPCFRCAGRPMAEPWAKPGKPRPAPSVPALARPSGAPPAASPPQGSPALTRTLPAPPPARDDRLRDEVLRLLRKYRVPLSVEEIHASAGVRREALERALSSLLESGAVERIEGPRATLYFAGGS